MLFFFIHQIIQEKIFMHHSFYRNIKQHNCFNIDINQEMFLEHQISKLWSFFKIHVTLETAIMEHFALK